MKKLLLAAAISCAGAVHSTQIIAAESTILKDIMGSAVFENSGLDQLNQEQLKVLENWVISNAVRTKRPTLQAVPSEPENEAAIVENPPELNSARVPQAANEAPSADNTYVRLAETQTAPANEEPVTQKYVRIESLQEQDRMVQPDLIRSRIDGPFKGWRKNKTRFKLENGEIWEQRQPSTFITNLDSPDVVIRKHRFGYTMEVPAVGRKVHVKRIR